MNDIVSIFDQSCHPVQLGNVSFNSLLWWYCAIINKSRRFTEMLKWVVQLLFRLGLSVNLMKTKIIIFNKCSKLILQCVKEYKYLGLMINCGENFPSAMTDLFSRSQKALFKVKSIFKNGYPSISTFLKTFDHTVKPVLLYSSEIWGMFDVLL